jgi:16S rRNA processing protein RimM
VSGAPTKLVSLGRVSGLLGVKGWVKVHSYTDPRESIVEFKTWILRSDNDEKTVEIEQGRPQGRTVVAKLREVDDREQARELVGMEISVERSSLAACSPGEYYWTDLEGLRVVTTRGETLGRIDSLFETGSHDVMVVEGERQRLIPFVAEKIVRRVELDEGVVVVDWDPTF